MIISRVNGIQRVQNLLTIILFLIAFEIINIMPIILETISAKNLKNFKGQNNPLGQVIYKKCVNVVVLKKSVTHKRTYRMHFIISLLG